MQFAHKLSFFLLSTCLWNASLVGVSQAQVSHLKPDPIATPFSLTQKATSSSGAVKFSKISCDLADALLLEFDISEENEMQTKEPSSRLLPAIKSFQALSSLPVTGKLDDATLQRLKLHASSRETCLFNKVKVDNSKITTKKSPASLLDEKKKTTKAVIKDQTDRSTESPRPGDAATDFARWLPKVVEWKDKGPHVGAVRCLLKQHGYSPNTVRDPNYFDQYLVGRTRQYQKDNRIENTGNVGPKTLRKLLSNKQAADKCAFLMKGKKLPIKDAKVPRSDNRNLPAPMADEAPDKPTMMQILKLQVLMDRDHFSSGEIDGVMGSNVRRAVEDWKLYRDMVVDPLDHQKIEALLEASGGPALKDHTLSARDIIGPYRPKLPHGMIAKSKVPHLSYRSKLEKLGELFQMSPALLQKLNDGSKFQDGDTIKVVALRPPLQKPDGTLRVKLDIKRETLYLFADDTLAARYPITINPNRTPRGQMTVTGRIDEPNYTYRKTPKAKAYILPQGPNNPVGAEWIKLSRKSFGIHGTPNPASISKNRSLGCVRLTNWDVEELASILPVGTVVRSSMPNVKNR